MAKIQTEKQKKLLKLISENLGLAKPKTLLQMFLDAGYARSTAEQQSTILVGLEDKLDPIVRRLVAHREKILDQLGKKLPHARYRDLVDALDKVTKNIQLLSNKPTDRTVTGLESLTDEELDEYIKSRKTGAGPSAA